jgi:hypothetical protein
MFSGEHFRDDFCVFSIYTGRYHLIPVAIIQPTHVLRSCVKLYRVQEDGVPAY